DVASKRPIADLGRDRLRGPFDADRPLEPAAAFSPDGAWIALELRGSNRSPSGVIRRQCRIAIIDANTGEAIHWLDPLRGEYGRCPGLTFSHDGQQLALGASLHDTTTTLQIWDIAEGRLTKALEPKAAYFPTVLRFSRDGRRLFAASYLDTKEIWVYS